MLDHYSIDKVKTASLKEFYYELHFDKRTELYVVKQEVFNALSFPDNSIVVFDKVFQELNSPSELAAILAHEYTHIKYRHGMKGIADLLSLAFWTEILFSNNQSDNIVSNIDLLLNLKHSREFEMQADIGGLKLLQEQGIDQNGMADLFKTMLKLPNEINNSTPSYLSTHPDTEDRLDEVEKLIKAKPSESKDNPNLERIFKELKATSITIY